MRIPLAVRALVATVIPLTVAGLAPSYLLSRFAWRAVPAWHAVFAIPMAAGIGLLGYCIVLFAITGRGTLAPLDPPTVFVARGPYRFTRNPMYVGVSLWLWGLAAFTNTRVMLMYALSAAIGFHVFVTLVEEPALRRRFGASYEAYVQRVPRWLGRRRGT